MDGEFRGTIDEIWRYPVKSMLGENLASAVITSRGLAGDRAYAASDPATGRILSAKREPSLFTCSARWDESQGTVTVVLPDGRELTVEDRAVAEELSNLLGRTVTLVRPDMDEDTRVEIAESSDTTEGPSREFSGLPGTFFDSAEIHIVTKSSLAALRSLIPDSEIDRRRFRPNLVVSAGDVVDFVEEGWTGGRVQVGSDVVLEILKPCSRCVMVTLPQEELSRDKPVLQTVARRNGNNLGVLARVVTEGSVVVGDELRVI